MIERIDAGAVSIGPEELDGIAADGFGIRLISPRA